MAKALHSAYALLQTCDGGGKELNAQQVPLGAILRERDAPEGTAPVAELVIEGERALLVAGGQGGRGNASFKSGRNKYDLPLCIQAVPWAIPACHQQLNAYGCLLQMPPRCLWQEQICSWARHTPNGE